MINGRYTEDEWDLVVATFPSAAAREKADQVRLQIEHSASRYVSQQWTAGQMRQAAAKRKAWEEVAANTGHLIKSIERIDRWESPEWGEEWEDREAKIAIVNRLQQLAAHSAANAKAYRATAFSGQKAPHRKRLYHELIGVWTSELHGRLAYSPNGPLPRFLRATLLPILGNGMPTDRGLRDIIENMRRGSSLAEDGLAPGEASNT